MVVSKSKYSWHQEAPSEMWQHSWIGWRSQTGHLPSLAGAYTIKTVSSRYNFKNIVYTTIEVLHAVLIGLERMQRRFIMILSQMEYFSYELRMDRLGLFSEE